MSSPKYPDVVVKLVGQDGNAFSILGRVRKAMRKSGVPTKEIAKYMDEATSGNYDHLISTTCRWVTTE